MYNQNKLEIMENNLIQKGKLSNHSFFRLGLNFKRDAIKSAIEKKISSVDTNMLKSEGKYHLHYGKYTGAIQPNQIHLMLPSTAPELLIHYQEKPGSRIMILTLRQNGIVQNDSKRTQHFVKIIEKLKTNKFLSAAENDFIFEQINALQHPLEDKPLEQATHFLLKTMDEYIASMAQKLRSKQVNTAMADDKIYFTQKLRTFVENPSHENWLSIRHAMKERPRYAFSWTGSSQVEMFLFIIKAQYHAKIETWEKSCPSSHPFLSTGWLHYVLSSFLAPYKLASFLIKEYQRAMLKDEIKHIHLSILKSKPDPINTANNAFLHKATEMTAHLQTYLSESDEITEDVMSYMDEFDEHLEDLKNKTGDNSTYQNLYKAINNLHQHIIKLVNRPVPSVNLVL